MNIPKEKVDNSSEFVRNLRKLKETRHETETRNNLKVASFAVTKDLVSPLGGSNEENFNNSKTETDPLCPDIRLVKRYLSHDELTKAIPSNTDVLTITGLYKQVTPPDFKRPPNSAANLVTLGIVATRSESKTSAQGNKYVSMTLSDLKYDISLALHGKALEKYWKVRPGTLVAIFNPNFYVQKAENVARNLALSLSKDACLLEIGQAKDLGQCESMTAASKQSKRCRNWVDVRRSHYCEFHLEQKFTTSSRPECNSASGKLWDPRNRANGKKLTVVQGGEVKWKRGLQFDMQANQGRFTDRAKFSPFKGGLPDAPIGRVFASTRSEDDRKTNSKKYEEGLGDKQQRVDREKWKLQRISDDNKLAQRLSRSTKDDSGRINKGDQRHASSLTREKSQFGSNQLRKLGFLPKRKPNSGTVHIPVPGRSPVATRTATNQAAMNNDSDSDLEII